MSHRRHVFGLIGGYNYGPQGFRLQARRTLVAEASVVLAGRFQSPACRWTRWSHGMTRLHAALRTSPAGNRGWWLRPIGVVVSLAGIVLPGYSSLWVSIRDREQLKVDRGPMETAAS